MSISSVLSPLAVSRMSNRLAALADQSRALILETFTSTAKAQIALINAIQVYCYTDTRIMKSFPALLKVLYNQDVVSDQAIIYWAEKGAKPQGKQHFLKATEGILEVGPCVSLFIVDGVYKLANTDVSWLVLDGIQG